MEGFFQYRQYRHHQEDLSKDSEDRVELAFLEQYRWEQCRDLGPWEDRLTEYLYARLLQKLVR